MTDKFKFTSFDLAVLRGFNGEHKQPTNDLSYRPSVHKLMLEGLVGQSYMSGDRYITDKGKEFLASLPGPPLMRDTPMTKLTPYEHRVLRHLDRRPMKAGAAFNVAYEALEKNGYVNRAIEGHLTSKGHRYLDGTEPTRFVTVEFCKVNGKTHLINDDDYDDTDEVLTTVGWLRDALVAINARNASDVAIAKIVEVICTADGGALIGRNKYMTATGDPDPIKGDRRYGLVGEHGPEAIRPVEPTFGPVQSTPLSTTKEQARSLAEHSILAYYNEMPDT